MRPRRGGGFAFDHASSAARAATAPPARNGAQGPKRGAAATHGGAGRPADGPATQWEKTG